MWTPTKDTWIISDTHFGHKNIVKYCNRPERHNEIMMNQWVDLVGDEDTVLHLGDVAVWYGDEEEKWQRIAGAMPGSKYLLRGNHDKIKDSEWANLGYTVIPEFIHEFDGVRVLFSHYPDTERGHLWDINIHGHIHNNDYDAKYPSGRDYRNVSIEVMDYKPVRLGDIL